MYHSVSKVFEKPYLSAVHQASEDIVCQMMMMMILGQLVCQKYSKDLYFSCYWCHHFRFSPCLLKILSPKIWKRNALGFLSLSWMYKMCMNLISNPNHLYSNVAAKHIEIVMLWYLSQLASCWFLIAECFKIFTVQILIKFIMKLQLCYRKNS